jgi:predicted transcriptional regulator
VLKKNFEKSEKENIFRILQNNDFSEFCCNKTKACNVLTKSKEQEDLLITLISKIENPELKKEYLKKLKKTMIKDTNKPSKSKISLVETLERFSKKKIQSCYYLRFTA